MFHPTVIAQNRAKLEQAFEREVVEYPREICAEMCARLRDAVGKKGELVRDITSEERVFIENEKLMTKVSFEYWAARYCTINVKGHGVDTLHQFLDSQRFVLDRIAQIELDIMEGRHRDGILCNILKASRQVGVTTLSTAIGAHRFTTRDHQYGLIASDTPGEQGSGFIFGMFEMMLENLPWFLRPVEKSHVKNEEIEFDGGSHIWVGAGKSMKGITGKRGQLGRGKTYSFVHLSELSTWEIAGQIDSALLPTMHSSPNLFALFESTAKGRGDWWHRHWRICSSARTSFRDFRNIFIPWYAEAKLASTPPADWVPADTTLAHARRCEESAPRWFGHKISLTPEQLYWYESTRAYYESKDDLISFLEEFGAADDDECFQHAGRGIFKPAQIQKMLDRARPLMIMAEVRPMKEIV